MADRPYMCRDEGLFLPECDDCSQLEGRVKALEDCCETATEELADHEERISSAESDIDTLQDDLMSAKSDIQSNTDAIDSIERLPEVTSADDGKVLTVVDGKWGIEPSSLVGEAIVGQSTVGEEETESDIDELKERMLSAESNIASLEENKQNKLTAGAGIQIQNDVISTTGSGDEGKADYTHIDECNDIVSFQADAKGVPLKSLTATINPKQSGSGDPSPDNVRPISGWDEVETHVSPTTSAEDGTTYTTDLPETVYGGSLDVVSGVLTIDRAMATYDGSSDENWTGANARFAIVPDGVYKSGTGRGEVLSNEFVYSSSATTVGTVFLLQSSGQVYVYPPASDSLANFKSWLSSNPLQIVYPLAEPRTIQLTPKQVTTLLGTNNVWADSGEVCLEYEHTQGVPTLKARRTTYTTTESSEDTFALTDYTASDILFVYVNGLMLVEGDEYTIEGTDVVLTTPITQAGTVVHIVALQARL